MNLQLEGTITNVFPVQSGTSKAGNAWEKQEFVLETAEQFSKKVCFTLFGDKVGQFASLLKNGAQVSVSFDVESREWNSRWFTECRAYKVEPIGNTISENHADMDKAADDFFKNQPDPSHHGAPVEDDSLPF